MLLSALPQVWSLWEGGHPARLGRAGAGPKDAAGKAAFPSLATVPGWGENPPLASPPHPAAEIPAASRNAAGGPPSARSGLLL